MRALIGTLDPTDLGQHVTVFVTTTLGALQAGLGTAQLSTGETITAGQARRLACDAGLIPAVLGTKSEVLGRTARVHSDGQRKAKLLETTECQVEGCTVPAAWCDSHHRNPWSRGGRTDQKDHDLLCGWHHRKIHDPRYEITYAADGTVAFHRRV